MKSILLLPIGNADPELAEGLLAPLAESFRAGVTVAASDLNLGEFFDPQRVQYNSTDIIHHISTDHIASLPETENSDESTKILAVSDGDLFIPILTYVFGEAELGGKVALVSYHRLQPERYGLPPNGPLLVSRLEKEALHELAHTYGLVHCSSLECVMRMSTYVEDIDLKGASFCKNCRDLLSRRSSALRT
ncbi:MAG: peptidase M54 [Bacteroidetes bacterium]|nr:peptidase M54 [Bacteroidota bacterium]